MSLLRHHADYHYEHHTNNTTAATIITIMVAMIISPMWCSIISTIATVISITTFITIIRTTAVLMKGINTFISLTRPTRTSYFIWCLRWWHFFRREILAPEGSVSQLLHCLTSNSGNGTKDSRLGVWRWVFWYLLGWVRSLVQGSFWISPVVSNKNVRWGTSK